MASAYRNLVWLITLRIPQPEGLVFGLPFADLRSQHLGHWQRATTTWLLSPWVSGALRHAVLEEVAGVRPDAELDHLLADADALAASAAGLGFRHVARDLGTESPGHAPA